MMGPLSVILKLIASGKQSINHDKEDLVQIMQAKCDYFRSNAAQILHANASLSPHKPTREVKPVQTVKQGAVATLIIQPLFLFGESTPVVHNFYYPLLN